jgi:hypothetical protein
MLTSKNSNGYAMRLPDISTVLFHPDVFFTKYGNDRQIISWELEWNKYGAAIRSNSNGRSR